MVSIARRYMSLMRLAEVEMIDTGQKVYVPIWARFTLYAVLHYDAGTHLRALRAMQASPGIQAKITVTRQMIDTDNDRVQMAVKMIQRALADMNEPLVLIPLTSAASPTQRRRR